MTSSSVRARGIRSNATHADGTLTMARRTRRSPTRGSREKSGTQPQASSLLLIGVAVRFDAGIPKVA